MKTQTSFDIIVYGGAFNPPHAGHADVIRQLSDKADRILVVPSFRHAFGKQMASFEYRVKWLEQMAMMLHSEGVAVQVDTCEQVIGAQSECPIFSIDLLEHIREREGLVYGRIGFAIGQDNLTNLPKFHRAEELLSRFTPVVAQENLHVHSTLIRNHLREGKDIDPNLLAPGLSIESLDYYRAA